MSPPVSPTAARVAHWYRDPVSCLQSTLATLLLDAGEDPLQALGLAWEFRYIPGDVRPEEFYWPCRFPGDIARSVLPYHDVRSTWRTVPGTDPLLPWQEALAAGRLPVVAVDNYHLPFRPAYRDVHAAHLVVVYGIDRTAGTVDVSDAMPPAFQAPLAVAHMLNAIGSENPPDRQGDFFSGGRIGGRWLDVHLATPFPPMDRTRLRDALATNLAGFTGGSTGPGHVGLPGLRRFRDTLLAAVREPDPRALGDVYTFGWGQQAQAALHGELLRSTGASWGQPFLAEAGRRVENVAHRWTAVRVTAAHLAAAARHGRALDGGEQLIDHAGRLGRAYEEALTSVRRAVDVL